MIPILLQLRQEGVDIVALATDNEAAMVTAHTITSNYTIDDILPFNELIHIRCAAHTINLIVQELLIHPTVAPIIEDMKETISFIRNNKIFRHKFLALQQDEHKSPRILPIPCDTRWNSYYVVLAQFLAVKSSIMGVLVFASGAGKTRKLKQRAITRTATHNDLWWTTATQLSAVLYPFTLAINNTQSDVATLHTANVAFNNIRGTLTHTVKILILISRKLPPVL